MQGKKHYVNINNVNQPIFQNTLILKFSMNGEKKEMDKKTTDVVSYIGWLGWLIAYLAGTKDESKFHLNQSLVLNIATVIGGIIPFLGWAMDIVFFVFMIMGIIYAANGEEKELPIIGSIHLLK